MERCVNIDWLELYVMEDPMKYPMNAEYWRKFYEVDERSYGTPLYKEMLTIKYHGQRWIEVRRAPHHLKEMGGVLTRGSMHIKMVNRFLYKENPIERIVSFCDEHHLTIKNITRIDVCCDLQRFDNRMKPLTLIHQYMRGETSKMNMANIRAFGTDAWDGREWNSLSWGSPHSQVSTKLYNKTKEIKDSGQKGYIVEMWKQFGFDISADVWRVEFSLKSQAKTIVKTDTGEFIPMTIDKWLSKANWVFFFHALCSHYFDFRKVEYTKDGNLKRKDRCQQKVLFDLKETEVNWSFFRDNLKTDMNRTEKMLRKYCLKIVEDTDFFNADEKASAQGVIDLLEYHRYTFFEPKDEGLSEFHRTRVKDFKKDKLDYLTTWCLAVRANPTMYTEGVLNVATELLHILNHHGFDGSWVRMNKDVEELFYQLQNGEPH